MALILSIVLFLGSSYAFHDGNQYDFGHSVCEGFRDLWDDPAVPLSERNRIGRAIYQTPEKIKEAKKLIKTGKRYDLGHTYANNMALPFGRYLTTSLDCDVNIVNVFGVCNQGIETNAMGNIGTQLDYYSHIFNFDTSRSNEEGYPSDEHFVFFNNYRGDQVFNNPLGAGDSGTNYLSVDLLPQFFTKAILVDVAGYKGVDILPDNYDITSEDFLNALGHQGVRLKEIGKGDAVIVNTGWGLKLATDPEEYYGLEIPGLLPEVVLDIIYDTGAAIIGSDNWGIDAYRFDFEIEGSPLKFLGGHYVFLPCGGGFHHETLKLDEWVNDARNGDAPWIGAYIFQPLPIEGGVGSAGRPVVYV